MKILKLRDLKQADKSHYQFNNYVNKYRWISIYHQIVEVLAINPATILEVGPGPGIFKSLAEHFDISVTTADIDIELHPDCVTTAINLPFIDNSFACVCSFQMLEHLPYEYSLKAFREMVRVAKKSIVISLPDAKRLWTLSIHILKSGPINFHITRPRLQPLIHTFDGEHYWEINKRGYGLERVIADLTRQNVELIKTYRVDEFPYHRFFVFAKATHFY